jgi:hypothetical protein
MRIPTQLFPAAALIVLLTGLSSAQAADPPKACDLLSHSAAETLFGAPLKTTVSQPIACIYYNSETSQINIHFLAIPDGLPPNAGDRIMKTLPHKDYGPDVIDTVAGLGEQNFFITDKQIPKDTLTVLYHRTIITLIVTGSKNSNLRPAMIEAVKRAMAKF